MLNTFEQRLKHEIQGSSNSFTASSHSASTSHSFRCGGPELLFPDLSRRIVGAAIAVHRGIGPGQLESVYQNALARELALCRIPHQSQVPIAMHYKGSCVGEFFADFIVDDSVIVELKVVSRLQPVHVAQVLSYLRATNLRLGLLINFDVPVLYRGVRRVVF